MKNRYLVSVFVLAGCVSLVSAGEHCTRNGSKLYCGYESPQGCYKTQNEYSDDGDDCTTSPSAKGCESCEDKIAACEKDGMLFTGVNETPLNSAPWGKGENCKTLGGTQIGGKVDCGNNFCKWDTCEKVAPDPNGDYGTVTANCEEAINNCRDNGKLFSSMSACENDVDVNPILSTQPFAGLTVVPHGRALHISSPKDASVTLYDLSGNRVLGGKVRAGNSVFSLTSQAPGVYYAVVQSGSLSQKVNVVLK
jgi:hypothetical protein